MWLLKILVLVLGSNLCDAHYYHLLVVL
jgi:hypothetical protein